MSNTNQTRLLQTQFIKLLENALPNSRWITRYDFWTGWLEVAACTVHQLPYHTGQLEMDEHYQAIEERYMQAIRGCSSEQIAVYKHLYHLTQYALWLHPWSDFLGPIYHHLSLEDREGGQSFTPPDVSRLIAALAGGPQRGVVSNGAEGEVELGTDPLSQRLKGRGLITLSDDAGGSGGLILIFADRVKRLGHDPVNRLLVELTDIDPVCFDMAYIQCSMTGLMALVRLGDTLTQQIKEVRPTPTLRCFWDWGKRVGLEQVWEEQRICEQVLELEQIQGGEEAGATTGGGGKRGEGRLRVELEGRV